MEDHLDLVRAIMELDPRPRIMGGVAEDAILHGRMTRAHGDVDVVVPRDELTLRVEQAGRLGFRDFHVRMEPVAHRPLVVGAIEGDLNLEFVVFDRAPDGRLYFDAPTPRGLTRVWMPDGAEDDGPRALDGVEVWTLSPLALHQIREAAAEIFGGFRPKDRVAQRALRKVLAGTSAADLAPRLDRLEEPAPLAPAARARRARPSR